MVHNTVGAERSAEHARRGDKLYMENNLLRVAGALFCHDPKRAATRTSEIQLNPGIPEKRITIRPDPKLGQPGQLAHKIFVALIKKHSDYGRPIANEISFTRREIGRLIGRKEWGGKDSEQLSRALREIHYTFVTTHFKEASGRYIEHSFNIFTQMWIERREFESDPIEACTVTLAEPIVRSLQDEHFVCLNHALMQQLGTIGQALYMRLFFHFANLYDGANTQRLGFQKRYADICAEWLGGLAVHAQRSIVEHNQLGPHLKQLVSAGFLSSYHITKARDADGLVISFKPGTAFYDDYDRFYRRRARGEIRTEFQPEQREIGEPLKLAYLFAEKRTGHPITSIAFVNSRDVETAKQLLTEITPDEAPAFLDFALAAARETNFDVQTLGGLRQYLARYKARQTARAAAKQYEAGRHKEEDQRMAYDRYRRQEALSVFESLPAEEQQAIETLAERAAARFDGTLRDSMRGVYRAQIAAQRHPERIKTVEEWKAAA
jgi:hypothetical protein